MRLIGYPRVSTDEQASEGISLEAQRVRLAMYCEALGHQLVAVVEDAGGSAKSIKRPGLQRALRMLRKGEADGLLVVKLDRLTRSVRDLVDLVDKYFAPGKSALISVGESIDHASAAGRMLLSLLAVIAQWEREAIGERTSEALRHKRAKGARLGAVPLGYRRQGDAFVADEGEQAVIRRVVYLAAAAMPLSAIAAALAAEGHRTKKGGKWHITTVRKLLQRVAKQAPAAT